MTGDGHDKRGLRRSQTVKRVSVSTFKGGFISTYVLLQNNRVSLRTQDGTPRGGPIRHKEKKRLDLGRGVPLNFRRNKGWFTLFGSLVGHRVGVGK